MCAMYLYSISATFPLKATERLLGSSYVKWRGLQTHQHNIVYRLYILISLFKFDHLHYCSPYNRFCSFTVINMHVLRFLSKCCQTVRDMMKDQQVMEQMFSRNELSHTALSQPPSLGILAIEVERLGQNMLRERKSSVHFLFAG